MLSCCTLDSKVTSLWNFTIRSGLTFADMSGCIIFIATGMDLYLEQVLQKVL